MSENFSHNIKATRKPHKCVGCLLEIPAGSPAIQQTAKDEGKWDRYYICRVCDAYVDRHRDDFDEGFGVGTLRREDPEGWEAVRLELEAQEAAR